MVSNNIQGPIPLIGRGLVHKPKGNYGSGEFSICQNVELVDDQIVTRRPMQAVLNSPEVSAFPNPYGIVGRHVGDLPFREDILFSSGDDVHQTLKLTSGKFDGFGYSSTSSTLGSAGIDARRVVGYFTYNNDDYAIVHVFDSGGSPYIQIRKNAGLTGTDVLVTVVTSGTIMFKSFFIYKERLWIVTNEGIYFSKATDPMTWTVPDGGFIRYADASTYSAVPSGDNIYIGTDLSLFVMTYTTDPNTDAYSRMVSSSGVTDLLSFESTVFGLDKNQFMEVSVNGIARIFELSDVYDVIPEYLVLRRSADNVLFINQPREGIGGPIGGDPNPYSFIPSMLTDEVMCFNIVNQFTSKWTFSGMDSMYDDFVIVDAYYMENMGRTVFLGYSISQGTGFLWYMLDDTKLDTNDVSEYDPSSFRGLDHSYGDGTDFFAFINVDLEIPSYVPDGSEYRNKKFRSLLFEGTLPPDLFECIFMFDNSDLEVSVPLSEISPVDLPNDRPPHPYRIGINQRAREISIRFKTDHSSIPNPFVYVETSQYFFTIRDARLLWTYIGGAVGTKGFSGDIVAP